MSDSSSYLEKELKHTIDAVLQAGSAVSEIYNTNFTVNEKKDKNPVTEADLFSNDIILESLKQFKYGILSEETVDDKKRLEKERTWIIDPLDGTTDFVNKTGQFTIMIGLVESGTPILGVVFNPVNGELYFGIRNRGAYLIKNGNKKKLEVSQEKNFNNYKLISSRHHRSELEQEIAKELNFGSIISCGSAGLKISIIAAGLAELNINPSNRTCEYDICAADVILTEAGGKLTDTKGNKFLYNKNNVSNIFGYVASNNQNHELLIEKINHNQNTQKGFVLWLTGLSASGKTTLANKVYEELYQRGIRAERLDGDVVRKKLTRDLGYSKKDRDENIRRVGKLAKKLSQNNIVVLASFISPYREIRDELKNGIDNFIEVFIDTPIEVCEQRDPKGMYKKARAGEIKMFTGISDPYETPESPDIHISEDDGEVKKKVEKVIKFLEEKKYL